MSHSQPLSPSPNCGVRIPHIRCTLLLKMRLTSCLMLCWRANLWPGEKPRNLVSRGELPKTVLGICRGQPLGTWPSYSRRLSPGRQVDQVSPGRVLTLQEPMHWCKSICQHRRHEAQDRRGALIISSFIPIYRCQYLTQLQTSGLPIQHRILHTLASSLQASRRVRVVQSWPLRPRYSR